MSTFTTELAWKIVDVTIHLTRFNNLGSRQRVSWDQFREVLDWVRGDDGV